jgi:hypothetical protein
MSLALVWIYFDDKMPALYRFSLRGAQEVDAFVDVLSGPPDAVRSPAAQECLKGAADALGMTPNALLHTLLQVKDDPYTKFLCSIWG